MGNGLFSEVFHIKDHLRESRIWNFISKSRHIVDNNITWNIREGNLAQFWEHSWGGYLIIHSISGLNHISQICLVAWGPLVKH